MYTSTEICEALGDKKNCAYFWAFRIDIAKISFKCVMNVIFKLIGEEIKVSIFCGSNNLACRMVYTSKVK